VVIELQNNSPKLGQCRCNIFNERKPVAFWKVAIQNYDFFDTIQSYSIAMSSIQDFYRDQTIFLTGATGFLGKLILEKLLRTCAVQKVYILVRPKHDKTLQQRFHSIFDSPVSNLELIKNHLDHEIFFKALVRVILFVGVTASRPLSL
jgi:hypothetical protein